MTEFEKGAAKVTARAGGDAQFEGWGLKLPLPRWGVCCVALLLIAAVGVMLYGKVWTPMVIELQEGEQERARRAEYQKHFREQPNSSTTLFDNRELGSLTVEFYSSDGCLLVTRKGPGTWQASIPYWILAKSIEREASPGAVAQAADGEGRTLPAPLFAVAAVASVSPGVVADARRPVAACTGRCTNPHPGEFQSWNGERRSCWQQVWRRWPDGCQHYQWYNACSGYWDSDANGPKLFWTCCVD